MAKRDSGSATSVDALVRALEAEKQRLGVSSGSDRDERPVLRMNVQTPGVGFTSPNLVEIEKQRLPDARFAGLVGPPNPQAGSPIARRFASRQTTVSDWLDEFKSLGRGHISQYQNMLVNAGLLEQGNYMPGRVDPNTLSEITWLVETAADITQHQPAHLAPSVESLIAEVAEVNRANARRGGGGGGGRAPVIQISNTQDLIDLLEDAAQATAGRSLESLGLDPSGFASAVQESERAFQQRMLAGGGEAEAPQSASGRARAFLEGKAEPAIEARQLAAGLSILENLVGGA